MHALKERLERAYACAAQMALDSVGPCAGVYGLAPRAHVRGASMRAGARWSTTDTMHGIASHSNARQMAAES